MYLRPSEGGLLASCEEVGWFCHCRFVSAFGVCISSGCDSCGPWVTPGCKVLLRRKKGKKGGALGGAHKELCPSLSD